MQWIPDCWLGSWGPSGPAECAWCSEVKWCQTPAPPCGLSPASPAVFSSTQAYSNRSACPKKQHVGVPSPKHTRHSHMISKSNAQPPFLLNILKGEFHSKFCKFFILQEQIFCPCQQVSFYSPRNGKKILKTLEEIFTKLCNFQNDILYRKWFCMKYFWNIQADTNRQV